MIRLYRDFAGEAWTDEGSDISDTVRAALKPIVDDAVAKGYSLRDLTNIIIQEGSLYCAEEQLRRGIAWGKANRKPLVKPEA